MDGSYGNALSATDVYADYCEYGPNEFFREEDDEHRRELDEVVDRFRCEVFEAGDRPWCIEEENARRTREIGLQWEHPTRDGGWRCQHFTRFDVYDAWLAGAECKLQHMFATDTAHITQTHPSADPNPTNPTPHLDPTDSNPSREPSASVCSVLTHPEPANNPAECDSQVCDSQCVCECVRVPQSVDSQNVVCDLTQWCAHEYPSSLPPPEPEPPPDPPDPVRCVQVSTTLTLTTLPLAPLHPRPPPEVPPTTSPGHLADCACDSPVPSGIAAADKTPGVMHLCSRITSHGFVVGSDGGGPPPLESPPVWLPHLCRKPPVDVRRHPLGNLVGCAAVPHVPPGIADTVRSSRAMSGETSLSGFPHGFVGPGGGGHLEVLPSFP